MVTIPLRLLDLHGDGFHLLMEVVVLGKTYQAVLDTGASKTVFDQKILQDALDEQKKINTHGESDIDLELVDSDKLSTGLGTNTMKSYSFVLPELKLGELTIKNQEIAVLDLSAINFAYKELHIEPVIGVLGGDILNTFQAVIRYKDPSISLRKTPVNRFKKLND